MVYTKLSKEKLIYVINELKEKLQKEEYFRNQAEEHNIILTQQRIELSQT